MKRPPICSKRLSDEHRVVKQMLNLSRPLNDLVLKDLLELSFILNDISVLELERLEADFKEIARINSDYIKYAEVISEIAFYRWGTP